MKVCIIGSGIVGLTVAREIINNFENIKIDLFDKNGFPSNGPSLNNSGVLHAGLYYPPNSLKSKLCIQGSNLLKEFSIENKLPLLKCGKILVPHNKIDEVNLNNIYENAKDNGLVTNLIEYKEAVKMQSQIVKRDIYLYSPKTSVFSSNAIIKKIILELKEKNISFIKQKIIKIDGESGYAFTKCKNKYKYDFIYNLSGPSALALYESDIQNFSKYILQPFVGQYAELSTSFKIKTNIYPVPNPELPFLGIHLTPRFNQNAIVGPNALPYFFNEIDKKDIEDIKFIFSKFGINLLLLLTNKNSYRNHAFKELTLNLRNKFLNSCNQFLEKKYFIEKSDINMNFSLSALRPQLISRGNLKFVNDFLYYKRKKCIHLINAVSPAFTSSFALAKYLSKYIK